MNIPKNGRLNINLEEVIPAIEAQGREDRKLLKFKAYEEDGETYVRGINAKNLINKNEIAPRISDLLERFEPWQQKELDLILNSLAYCGAAEAIRVVFKDNLNESLKTEYIEMTCAKIIEDEDIF